MATIHALVKRESEIVNCIKTQVTLKNVFTDKTIETLGLWDTGATHSVITKNTAEMLGLTPVSRAITSGVHGDREVNVYYVNITLNNDQIVINTQVTECEELSTTHDTGMLIGMNIISLGDFIITNCNGKTIMSFRIPSVKSVDYVDEVAEFNKYQRIHCAWMKSGNDKCPCGSGKKYKNCHENMFDKFLKSTE